MSSLWSVGGVIALVGAAYLVQWTAEVESLQFNWLFLKGVVLFIIGVQMAFAAPMYLFSTHSKKGDGADKG